MKLENLKFECRIVTFKLVSSMHYAYLSAQEVWHNQCVQMTRDLFVLYQLLLVFAYLFDLLTIEN